MIRNLIWTISLFNLIHSSTSFVAPSTPLTTLEHSHTLCSKINPSNTPGTTSTTISASESVSSSSPIPKDDVNCERLETLLDETLRSNPTAASSLLNLINDTGDGSVVDRLLQLLDNLPAWTKVRILGKFSRRARRASLRRVLNVPNGSEVTVSVRRKAFVSALQSIAGAAYNDDIKTIERDNRRESKNATPVGIARTLEQEDDATEVERTRINFMNEQIQETEEKAGKKIEVTRLARATEKVRVQAVEDRDEELEALKEAEEKREAAALAKTTEESRRQAIKDRNEDLEAEKRMTREKKEAEQARLISLELESKHLAIETEKKAKQEAAKQARLRLVTNELNQRALLGSRLELHSKYLAIETEKMAKQRAAEEKQKAAEEKQKAAEEKQKAAEEKQKAVEARARSIKNELNQRALLESRLKIVSKRRALEEEKKAVAEKYGSMELGLRAFTILDDLGMLENA